LTVFVKLPSRVLTQKNLCEDANPVKVISPVHEGFVAKTCGHRPVDCLAHRGRNVSLGSLWIGLQTGWAAGGFFGSGHGESSAEAMASKRICVRLLSGTIVYEGPRPQSLAELRDEVAATMGCMRDELAFCDGAAEVPSYIEDLDEYVTVVRDEVMGLLDEFLKHMHKRRGKLPEHLLPVREHRRLLLAALSRDGRTIEHASPELLADRAFVLAAVAISARALQYASPEFRADRDIVLSALANERSVLQHAWTLKHAAPELQADKGVVLAAVQKNGHALVHASAQLRADRDVVLTAVAHNGYALQYASPELQADRDVVLAAVASDGYSLGYASFELRADRSVVLAALARNGHALQHASPELRADRDIVAAAVASSRYALQYAV